jgi:hypothetical protein
MDQLYGRVESGTAKGAISTKSGALKEYPYGFSSRFEGKPGTNPEELNRSGLVCHRSSPTHRSVPVPTWSIRAALRESIVWHLFIGRANGSVTLGCDLWVGASRDPVRMDIGCQLKSQFQFQSRRLGPPVCRNMLRIVPHSVA